MRQENRYVLMSYERVPGAHDELMPSLASRLKQMLRIFLDAPPDPTRMSASQRRDIGIDENDIAWFRARHDPIIK